MRTGKVSAIVQNLVNVEVDIPIMNKEVCYVVVGEERLMAEVIKVQNGIINIQVFENTRGVKIGDTVEFTGDMIEVDLAPGLLKKIVDGLQNDLEAFPETFLKRGSYNSPIDLEAVYDLKPLAKVGDKVKSGDWLASVKEGFIDHKIMVPFKFSGEYIVKEIKSAGKYKIKDVIARLSQNGKDYEVTMIQKWPIYKPILAFKEKASIAKIFETGIRTIDSLNPITDGGTGFIPGPFGCGKTVLQHNIAQYAEADVIIVAACGERANEVVELFVEFPELSDPHTGKKLIERTIIVCNTSNMPVAAREASVYTAMTMAEYYRQMGLSVLLLADSTSRWAQALREISNKLEELPGPDAFPMDLTSIISSFYARSGKVILNNNTTGSVTFIGTVSPAGGNLKEPVTEATRKAARCFYALSQKRADSKRYPAIDPVESYSKYLEYEEVKEFATKNLSPEYISNITTFKNYLLRGKEAAEQINILGDDGVPLTAHLDFWRSEIIDFAFLQQDAFDKIDAYTPMNRQIYMMELLLKICKQSFKFTDFNQIHSFFKDIINQLKQMNYTEFNSESFLKHQAALEENLNKMSGE